MSQGHDDKDLLAGFRQTLVYAEASPEERSRLETFLAELAAENVELLLRQRVTH
ncbi:hypothetical protein HHL28_07425 [Aerophototrophica crusticola]|uniref:Uncharacterized protein n=1 Tax=Aerophototrophica crusticola TaxID=1709002 RepID=A0A858R680_9PROT|nr:hypothetical protein HHL28_07425 [Rhodospirillaceae bacterium B3]